MGKFDSHVAACIRAASLWRLLARASYLGPTSNVYLNGGLSCSFFEIIGHGNGQRAVVTKQYYVAVC